MVDAHGSGPCARKGVEVQVLSSASSTQRRRPSKAGRRRLNPPDDARPPPPPRPRRGDRRSPVALRRRPRRAAPGRRRRSSSSSPRHRWRSPRGADAGRRLDAEQRRFATSPARRDPRAPRSTGATGSSRTASRSSCPARSVPSPRAGCRASAASTANVDLSDRGRTGRRDDPRPAALRSSTLADGGAGIKIGIIDDGVDQTHPFFDPAGYAMPAGFPKGQTAYTTAKVIVATVVPAPGRDLAARGQAVRPGGVRPRDARRRHRRRQREHARPRGTRISGIAPRALHRQLQGADDPDRRRTSGSTATRPRSSPRSRRPSPTGWT